MSAGRTAANVVKTAIFLVVFWAVFLFGLPIAISVVEVQLGIQRFPPMPVIAGLLLMVSTALVIWSALTLSLAGDGTPLLIDPPRALTTTGPYAFVRHPFAAGATAQIVGLALALGSIPVLGYAASAMAIWYFVIRPREERTLEERFGQAARAYRASVRGFRPQLNRHRVR